MNILNKYNIAHKGLSLGKHLFEFELNDLFFKSFDESPIMSGSGNINIELTKNSSMLSLVFDIDAQVGVECDRCLEEVILPIEYEGELIVRFSESEDYSDGDIMWLSASENEIPLAQYIYESIILSLPYQRVHSDDENGKSGCNPEMLQKFQIISQEEFDGVVAEAEECEEVVPLDNEQWEKLKQLKDKLETQESKE